MKLSLSWLEDFVDTSSLSPAELASELTMKAFEVEELTKIGDKLEGAVVLGEIREITKHPDADKLQITQTCIGYKADGSEDLQQIVCGARNIKVGQKVPVATIGSKVVDRHSGGVLEIRKSKIRGVESCGMLCSPDELGYSESESEAIKAKQGDGIYILDELAAQHKLGSDIRSVLGFKTDYVFDIGARSNRGDALSIYGQAREISALLKQKLKGIEIKDLKANPQIKTIKPQITDTNDCAVFYTITVEGLKVGESPSWLKSRLEAVGQKSINNVVDVSNYVLLELGQPLHFYDRDKLKGDTLTARRAAQGEAFKSLDDKEYKLSEVNLVIADAAGPECLAGVMGGYRSQVTTETKAIVIEAAAFNAATVRRSARAAGIESESKKRFERGVDKANTKTAILRAVELLTQIASEDSVLNKSQGASPQTLTISELQQAGDATVAQAVVDLDLSQIKRYLGIELSANAVLDLLAPLGIIGIDVNPTEQNQNTDKQLKFSIPSFRQNDIKRPEDLIEEIGRLYGFDNIPAVAPKAMLAKINQDQIRTKVKTQMLAAGFSQAMLSSLIGETLIKVGSFENESAVRMSNPLSEEHSVLRQSLIPGLIQAASRNYAYDKSKSIRLFELGKIYFKADIALAKKIGAEISKDTQTIEKNKVAAICINLDENWNSSKRSPDADFYEFKSLIEALYPRAKFEALAPDASDKSNNAAAYSHPGITAIVTQDKKEIGYISKLHPSTANKWDLPERTYLLELDLPKLNTAEFKAIAHTPISERDITVDIQASSTSNSAAIVDLIKKEAGTDLSAIKLVSRFQKDANSPTSLSYRIKWQSETETLSGEDLDARIIRIKNLLQEKLGVTFRM